MSRIIPVTLNKLSMAEAFRFYRDELKLHVYPVDGPWSKKADPGKKPSVKAWWNYDPKECDVEQYFRPQRCHNIGVCPTRGLIVLDLDSKPDEGKSVYEFLASRPNLAGIPRHRTRGGCHLVFFCDDLPEIKGPRGGPYDKPLVSQLSDAVTAELYHSNHSNIVFPPSTHPTMFKYEWDVTGEIPTLSWAWIVSAFGFKLPDEKDKAPKEEKKIPFWELFKGDLKHLDLVKLMESLKRTVTLIDAGENKYAISCPWESEHTDNGRGDSSSTVIWQKEPGAGWPAFKCLHSHCDGKEIKDVLLWAETQEKGIVDRHCSQQRVWAEGQLDFRGLPRILRPQYNELDSISHTKLGIIMGGRQAWFDWLGKVCLLDNIRSGKVYVGEEEEEEEEKLPIHMPATVTGFKELEGIKASGHCEYFCVPGYLQKDSQGNMEFIRRSFGSGYCNSALEDPHLLAELPNPHRILTVPIPFLDPTGKRLVYPTSEYDGRFHTYMVNDAPPLDLTMSVEKAKEILNRIHAEFCFLNEQSKVHALARIITPFARGLLGFTTRVPLWIFRANRPRAGKDYLAVMTILTYEGIAAEDSPIGRDQEETGKRIMSAARNGRRFMHFSNCQGRLDDRHLTQAITNERITARRLGTNEASSDLSVPNSMEFSISGNLTLTYSEDIDERGRQIFLAFYDEEANARKFKNPFLHRSIRDHRGDVLSAIAALFRNWEAQGMPLGKEVFTTYPQWAEIIGGVMQSNDLGDPCQPFKNDRFNISGDRKTEAMAALYEVCFSVHGDAWIKKDAIYSTVHEAMQDTDENCAVEALDWFGPLKDNEKAHANRIRLGLQLQEFNFRILEGIQMQIQTSSNAGRNLYRFVKQRNDAPGSTTSEKANDKPENPQNVSEMSEMSVSVPSFARGKNVLLKKVEKEDSRVSNNSNGPANTDISDRTDSPSIALDIETYSEDPKSRDALDPFKGKVRLVSVANSEGIQTFDLKQAPLPREIAAALMERELIIHNAAFELRFLGVKFEIFPENVFCTLTADWLLSPRKEQIHDLKSALSRHHGIEIPKGQATSDWGAFVLTGEQIEYAKDDVRFLHRHRDVLEKKLIEAGLADIFEMESRLLPIIARMEAHGFPVNPDLMRGLKATADINAGNLAAVLRKDFGDERLNPASTQELLEAFKKGGIELEDTSEQTLRAMDDPRAETILLWRAENKLSSGIKTLLEAEHAGRIYAIFNPRGTVTGRFSSRHPNLQNVTRGKLRSCFIPSGPDRRLIVADYSQIELRVAALIAKETVMIAAFQRGEDLHRQIAAVNLGKDSADVTPQERATVGKSTNFGFLYGQAAKGFAAYAKTNYGLSLSIEDAERFRENFFSTYPALRRWHTECKRKSVNSGNDSARTVMGRLLLARKDDSWARFNMFTEYVVSGSCADLIKAAMIKVSSVMPSDVHLVATVHDELVLDAPADMAKQYCGMVRYAMIDAFTEMFGTEVPVEVEAKVCSNWSEK